MPKRDRAHWEANCHLSGQEYARKYDMDGGNARALIRKAREEYPKLDWYQDVRHATASEDTARVIGCVKHVPRIRVSEPKQVRTEHVVILPDPHGHDVDEKAWGCALGYIKHNPVTKVIISGDGIDLECLSRYQKRPEVALQLEYEIECARILRKSIDDVTDDDCEKEWQEGNHERRLTNWLMLNAGPLLGRPDLNVASWLELEENGWTYTPTTSGKSTYSMVGEIAVGHFDKAVFEPGYSAAALMRNRAESVLQSHTHKIGGQDRRLPGGRQLIGYEIGCLCSLDPSYCTDPMWAHGFGVLKKVVGSNRYQFTQMRIVGGNLLDGDLRY